LGIGYAIFMRFFILFIFVLYYNMKPQNEHITTNDSSINENQTDINDSIYRLITSIPIVVSLIITYIIEYVLTVIKIIYGRMLML